MKRFLVALVVVAVTSAAALFGGVFLLNQRFHAPGPLGEATTLIVARGASREAIANQLAQSGVLADPWTFRAVALLRQDPRPLKAGEYAFQPHISPAGVFELLASGRTVIRRLTIPEGLTAAQVVSLVRRADGLEGDPGPVPAEGELLPETYFYSWGDTRTGVIERQRRAMHEALAQLWPMRAPDLPIKSPAEAVVLASIVEKETARDEERAHIAAVYLNRLKRGMRLQSDPTVAYGLANGAGVLDHALTRADLDSRHAWNTYIIDGLPPTPIANPGRAALAAALNPAPSDDIYFVADGAGGHVFARTLDEHNRNVARLRRIERERGGARQGDGDPGSSSGLPRR